MTPTTSPGRVERVDGPGLCSTERCGLPMVEGPLCSTCRHDAYPRRQPGERLRPNTRQRKKAPSGLPLALYWIDLPRLVDHIDMAPECAPTGLCAGSTVPFFDLPDQTAANRARVVCAGCPSLWPCLGRALRDNEGWGVWGGTTVAERTTLRKRLRKMGVTL